MDEQVYDKFYSLVCVVNFALCPKATITSTLCHKKSWQDFWSFILVNKEIFGSLGVIVAARMAANLS